ncbi:S-methyl-5'-thioinosine phosphorylase [Quisquiliibacterium transsilvanicum]|jgi:5'-methylthioadenosine phosphorylase|uniref:Probable 6-oxopurine nucleoside phosphorylase n=1 Tax=Quisquiliibacterium transsilvanicum TaxID=1549638 RepID=A0A7W8M737_9BURK|nr:S-methyl-5'-thioinosine phosphorylase [Quisquiliibacterium transsilvanicum]MBB5270521.1 5'-methylthioadenosine phosphorylase [Quisquiliibacterium transsilvanicum]
MKFGIIGGSGLARLAELRDARRQVVRTPWGDPSCPLTHGTLDGVDLVFLARHGYGHTLAPHEINYRANIWALKQTGVDGVVSVATVGGIRDDFGPGTLVLPDQIIDYTTGRCCTFFEGPGQPVVHVDFTWPYDDQVRGLLARAAQDLGETMVPSGVYGCTQGPRLETAAEIRMMERDGCDLVGMTGMPEAVLARELGLPYAALAVVANHAAGKGDSSREVSLDAITLAVEQAMVRVRAILSEFVRLGARGG